MPQNTVHAQLRTSFRQANRELWQQAASEEIEGKNPFEFLSWKSLDEINFSPYYDHSDLVDLNYLKKFKCTVGENFSAASTKWLNLPQLVVNNNENEINKISIEHLQHGADGLIYVLTSNPDLHKLLNKVEWPYCSLFFVAADNNFLSGRLSEFILQNNFAADSISGTLFWDTCPKKDDVTFYLKNKTKIKSLGINISLSSPVKEIADGLISSVHWIENLKTDNGLEKIIRDIAFSLPVGADFFESIAKLRALRILWYQVTQVYGVKNYKPSDLHIHARSVRWVEKKYEPHSNMIKATTAAMASVLGNCNSLTIEEENADNTMMRRVARNISSVLKEESHFGKVLDPVAGSYAINVMVDKFAKQAWALFQSKIKS